MKSLLPVANLCDLGKPGLALKRCVTGVRHLLS